MRELVIRAAVPRVRPMNATLRGAGNRSGPGWATWAGLAVVATAAAVLSFSALADLAIMCGVPRTLAPLLPVAIDAGAGVACTVWLSRRANEAATRYAAWMTWALLATTVAGNALHSGLVAAELRPVWWVAVAVGAVSPAVLGAVVHLAVLTGRQADTERPEVPVETSVAVTGGAGTAHTVPAVVGQNPTTELGGHPAEGSGLFRTLSGDSAETPRPDQGYSATGTPAPGSNPVQPGPTADDRAAELIAEGAGRRRLAAELGVTEHAARQLIDERRNGHAEVTG